MRNNETIIFRNMMFLFVILFPLWSYAAYFSGEMDIQIADDFKHHRSETFYSLIVNNKVYELKINPGVNVSDLKSGDKVSIEGHLMINAQTDIPVIETYAIKRLSHYKAFNLEAEKRTVGIFLINFIDKKVLESTDVFVQKLFTHAKSVKNYFLESSFGQVDFIQGANDDGKKEIYTLNIDISAGDACDPINWAKVIKQKARQSGINLKPYLHLLFILPKNVNCQWSGLGDVGCLRKCHSWYRDRYTSTFAHELGHNLGLSHASTDYNNDGVIDNEYGDGSSVMGRGYSRINALQRYQQAKWFAAYPNMVREMVSSGRVTINSLDKHPESFSKGVQIVKIIKDGVDRPYYLSYRTNTGEFGMNEKFANKVSIHRRKGIDKGRSLLIKVLAAGDIFVSPEEGLKLRILKTNDDRASVKVYIKDTCGFKKHPCSLTANKRMENLQGKENFFILDVPTNASELKLETSVLEPTTQTALIIRYGDMPTSKKFDCKSNLVGNHQVCEIQHPQAGKWYIKLASSAKHQGISLDASV